MGLDCCTGAGWVLVPNDVASLGAALVAVRPELVALRPEPVEGLVVICDMDSSLLDVERTGSASNSAARMPAPSGPRCGSGGGAAQSGAECLPRRHCNTVGRVQPKKITWRDDGPYGTLV